MTCQTHLVRLALGQNQYREVYMADFTLAKPIFGGKQSKTSAPGNIAYALFVLFCFWAGSQLLNILVHAPGVYEHLMQVQDTGRPRVAIGLGVSTIFGVIPFLIGCVILGVVAMVLRWRRCHSRLVK